jgi:hypothetical protein
MRTMKNFAYSEYGDIAMEVSKQSAAILVHTFRPNLQEQFQ